MEEDKSAINFHKLILLILLILCEPKQNKWELWGMWGLEVEEVAENPPEDDNDGGDDGDDGGVEVRVEAWEVAAPIAVGQEQGDEGKAEHEQGVVANGCKHVGMEQGVNGALRPTAGAFKACEGIECALGKEACGGRVEHEIHDRQYRQRHCDDDKCSFLVDRHSHRLQHEHGERHKQEGGNYREYAEPCSPFAVFLGFLVFASPIFVFGHHCQHYRHHCQWRAAQHGAHDGCHEIGGRTFGRRGLHRLHLRGLRLHLWHKRWHLHLWLNVFGWHRGGSLFFAGGFLWLISNGFGIGFQRLGWAFLWLDWLWRCGQVRQFGYFVDSLPSVHAFVPNVGVRLVKRHRLKLFDGVWSALGAILIDPVLKILAHSQLF